ncbi:MAG: FAD-dependent oxidoreductase [Bacteroidota bacterium]
MLSIWEKDALCQADYIIIGSGIVGLSTAASILEQAPQARVKILERGLFPTGASTRNAGFACFGSAGELWADIQERGEAKVLALVARRWNGIRRLRERLGDAAIQFQAKGGSELIFTDQADMPPLHYLNEWLESIFEKPVFEERMDLRDDFGFAKEGVRTLIFNPLEGQIHSGWMMHALTRYVQQKGATIMTGAKAQAWQSDLEGVEVEVWDPIFQESISLRASKLAICTNAFSKDLGLDIDLKPGRGQILLTEPIKDLPIKGTFHFDEGYYYFRDYEQRLLFGGGRNIDFKAETSTEIANTRQIMEDLKGKIRDFILPGQEIEIEDQWAGIMAFTPEGEPILRELTNRVMLGVGLNGMGVAIGSNLGEEIAQKLLH